eukprot:2245267-Rhodomonas_salina.2
MVGRAWEDALLQEREENRRLKAQQKEQAAREERLARRLVALKEQREALLEGRTVEGHTRDGKIRELREKIDDLSRQHRDLRARLDAAKRAPGTAAAAGKRGARPGSAPAAGARSQTSASAAAAAAAAAAGAEMPADPNEAKAVIEDLKNKILETNQQIKRLEEQRVASPMPCEAFVSRCSILTRFWVPQGNVRPALDPGSVSLPAGRDGGGGAGPRAAAERAEGEASDIRARESQVRKGGRELQGDPERAQGSFPPPFLHAMR